MTYYFIYFPEGLISIACVTPIIYLKSGAKLDFFLTGCTITDKNSVGVSNIDY